MSRLGKTQGIVNHANFSVNKAHIAFGQAQISKRMSHSQVNLQKSNRLLPSQARTASFSNNLVPNQPLFHQIKGVSTRSRHANLIT